MAKTELNERDTRLAQWLNEAYAKEAELEADLTAHIALTQKATYKKRLQQHLKETREHKRAVARRIKQLGADASSAPAIPGVPSALGEAAGKTVAAVKGQVGVARAMVTHQPETHLRNAQEELREEHVEIALYARIETFATEVGDKETAQLAKRIGREEERMAKYLTAELPRLVKELVRAEVPRDQRGGTSRTRRTSTRSRSAAGSGSSRTTRSRATSGSGTSSRSTGAGSSSRSSRSGGTGSSSRSSRSTGASASSRSGGSASSRSGGSSSSRSTRSGGASSGSGSRSNGSSGSSRSGSRSRRSTTSA
jgi:ferritin-like metal-binding protein YciE